MKKRNSILFKAIFIVLFIVFFTSIFNIEGFAADIPIQNNKNMTFTFDEEIEVFAFRFEEGDNEDDIRLFPIESDEEWKMVEEMFHTLVEEEE